MQVRDSPPAESLRCVLEQDTLSAAKCILVQFRKTDNRPDMTDKLLTGALNIKSNIFVKAEIIT